MTRPAAQTTGWRPLETAPSHGDNVWVFGGMYREPSLRPADGDWWREARSQSKHAKRVPTHWAPLEPPPPLPEMGAARG